MKRRPVASGIAVVAVAGLPCAFAPDGFAAPAEPADVRAWAEAYDQLRAAGPGVDAAGRTLEWGGLRLSLRAGRLWPVTAAGRVTGVIFSGTGSLRYVSDDPLEAATYRRNAERASSYRVDAQGAIGDDVTRALVLLSSGADTLAGAGGWPQGAATPEADRALAEHRERWRDAFVAPARQFLAQAALDPPEAPVVVAQVTAAHHDVFYLRDTLRRAEEALGVLGNSEFEFLKSRRVYESLSRKPLGRERLAGPTVPVTLTDLDATLRNPSGATAQVKLRQAFRLHSPARVLALALPDRQVGNPLASPGSALLPYRLERATDGSGRELPFAQMDDDLLVDLGRRAAAEETLTLDFDLSGDVLYRPDGDNYWLLARWYPRPVWTSGYTWHAVVKTRKPFVPFSSGNVVRRWEEGDLACAEFRETRPIEGIVVLAGKYTTITDARERLTVNVSTYAHAKADASRRIAGLVHAFAAFLEPLLGPFPFREMHVIEINSYGFGVAPPGIIFITKEAFGANPFADPLANVTVQGINQRLAHEVAHAYWGNVVLPAQLDDRWMSESLAEYYAGLAMTLRDKNDYNHALDEWKLQAKADGSVYQASRLSGKDAFRDRQRLLYSRGPLMLHALRRELGDQAFFTVFKSLVSSFPGKLATTRDVLNVVRLVAGDDRRPFFDRYLFGTEIAPADKK